MSELFFTKQSEEAWRLNGGEECVGVLIPKRNSGAVKRQKGRQAVRRTAHGPTKDS